MGYIEDKNTFIAEFVRVLENSNLSLFLGAGMSFEVGLPSWKNLLANLSREIGIDIEDSQDYYQIAQYCENYHGFAYVRNEINTLLTPKTHTSSILNRILKLPTNSFWTTNFDRVLEHNIEMEFGYYPEIIYRDVDLTKTRKKSARVIYKMNGHIDDYSSWILTKQDLEGYEYSHQAMLTFLKRELIVNTFLFLGYSFSDNLILSALHNIRKCFGEVESSHFHYTILEERENPEFPHFILNLNKSYGIKCLIIPKDLFGNNLNRTEQNFAINTERINIIDTISQHIKMKQIYISGSYREISSQEENFSIQLSRCLTANILEHGYRICNSFGKGVGTRIIEYASEWLIEHNQQVDKKLILKSRSFHNYTGTNDDTKKYRTYIMRDSGIALFMFGQGNANVSESAGVQQEFIVAKELGLKIIPLGVTGYESKKIWNEIKTNISSYGYLEKYIDILGKETDVEKLVRVVITIITELQRTIC